MKDLIKASIAELKKNEGFVYETEDGKLIDLQEAAKKGIAVTPKDPKESVLKKLSDAGLDLADGKFVNELNELIGLITSGSSKGSRKRRTFSNSEKEKIIAEWKKVEAKGKKTKAAFAREIGIGYQTFINWLRG